MTNEDLCTRIQNATGEARKSYLDKLYHQNQGLIYAISKRYMGWCPIEDLIQEGAIGLIHAAENYDPARGASFATYARICVRCYIQIYLRGQFTPVTVPAHRLDEIFAYKEACSIVYSQIGRRPLDKELAVQMGVPQDKVRQIRKYAKALTVRSLSEPAPSIDDESITLADQIPDPVDHIAEMDESIQQSELASRLWAVVGELEEKEQRLIIDHYKNGKSYIEIGEDLGLTQNGIHQMKRKSFDKIRRSRKGKELRTFLDEAESISLHASSVSRFMETQTSAPELYVLVKERRGDLAPV